MARLEGPGAGESWELPRGPDGEVILGRSRAAGIRVDLPAVSRRHARVFGGAEGWRIEDLGSRNGTRVNGRSIREPVVLHDGDEIVLGEEARFRFVADEGAARTLLLSVGEGPEPDLDAATRFDATRDLPAGRLPAGEKLHAVLRISRALAGDLDLDRVLGQVAGELLELFPLADRVAVLLPASDAGDGPDDLRPAVVRVRPGCAVDLPISHRIVEAAFESREGLLLRDAQGDIRFGDAQSVLLAGIHAVLCVPLLVGAGDRPMGVLLADSVRAEGSFTEEDLELLVTVASQAALALDHARLHAAALERARLERDLAVAAEIQRSFLPREVPRVPGYSFAAAYRPLRTVGGDLYDHVSLPDGDIAVAVADVAGKGVAAALQMARLSAELRRRLVSSAGAAEVLDGLGEVVAEIVPEGRFVTMALLRIDPATGLVRLSLAGHPPPLLVPAVGVPRTVGEDARGLPLGLFPGIEYGETSLVLEPGDTLLAFTDGLPDVENTSGQGLGDDGGRRLLEILAGAPREPGAMIETLLQEVDRYRGNREPTDDLCLVAVRRDEA